MWQWKNHTPGLSATNLITVYRSGVIIQVSLLTGIAGMVDWSPVKPSAFKAGTEGFGLEALGALCFWICGPSMNKVALLTRATIMKFYQ
jgi:hypothetical protein